MKLMEHKYTIFAGANTLFQGAVGCMNVANGDISSALLSLTLCGVGLVCTIVAAKLESTSNKLKERA